MAQGRRSSERDAAIRRRLAWEKSIMGWTQYRIADHLGVSQQQIHDDLKKYRSELTPVDREKLRQDQHARAEFVREKLDELIAMNGAPLTAGKDGDVVLDPETGAVARDFGGRIAALRELRMWDERLSKLADLDEKVSRTEQHVDVTVHGSVDAELESLARELGLNDQGPATAAAETSEDQETSA